MFSTRSLSQGFAKYVQPSVTLTSSQRVVCAPAVKVKTSKPTTQVSPYKMTGTFGSTSTVHLLTTKRFAHTDIPSPDFDNYRRDATKDPNSVQAQSDDDRRAFTYVMVGSSAVGGVYFAKNFAQAFVEQWSASADVLAVSKSEVNLSEIPEGKCVTLKWRGKPLFVKHRTADEIRQVREVNMSDLKDQERDEDRVKDERYLICLGVCTHLGCVPVANAGEFGGYFCPCHGSHYDASGRIRKGPAPLNLEVPYYSFSNPTTVVVG